MAFRTNDRVKETSTTTGTGNLTLLGAVSQFQAFSVFANNDTFFYAIVGQTGTEWEVGIGTYVSATPALARTTVLESSNADALVTFSAGTKDVFVTRPARLANQLRELAAAPGAAETDWTTLYAFDDGAGSQLRTKDEYGLISVISSRNAMRARKPIFIGELFQDSSVTDEPIHVGIQMILQEGTPTKVVGDVDGERTNYATAATLDADAGFPGPFTQVMLNMNPDITVKFKVVSTAVRRFWCGFFEADHMASDATAATHKFALRLSTSPAVTGFTIVHSDGTTETVEAQIAASDALVHTIRLIGDNANSRWGYSFDNAAVVWITTNIPTASQLMGFQCELRTLEAVAKNFNFWWADGSWEK